MSSIKKNHFDTQSLPNLNHARQRLNKSQTYNDIFLIDPVISHLGQGLKYHIRTYGCQSNIRDSETLGGILEQLGFTYQPDIYQADLIILNTCAIRENAEQKVFGEIGFIKKMKRLNPNFKFGIAGCMPQEEKVITQIINQIKHVDFVFGTHNLHQLPKILEQVYLNHKQIINVWSKEGDIIENLPTVRNSPIKAFVNIMYGCDNFCTYCIVPYTRGKIRSRSENDILKEVQALIAKGYQEITLIGQNVNSYGKDLKTTSFAKLLEKVALTSIKRLRFVTSNPWNFDEDIIDVMAKYHNIMPYVHLPIQSGDEEILTAMNRKMKIQTYLDKVNYLKAKIPNCAISTDIIVGFPNETDEQFQHTLELYEKVKFDNAYTFIFSPREGTPASKYSDNISLVQKKQRLAVLNELVRKFAKINNQLWKDQIVEVLVEGSSKSNKINLTGYSPQWKVVNFTGHGKPGEIVKVKITGVSRFSLNGEQV